MVANLRIEDTLPAALDALDADMQRERGFFDRKRAYEDLDIQERDALARVIRVCSELLLTRGLELESRERRVRLAVEELLAFYSEDTS